MNSDTGDKKRLKDALIDSEERYRLIFEMCDHAILLTQHDEGNILAGNPAACKMFGYSQEEICELGRADIIDVTDTRWPSLLTECDQCGHVRGRVRCIKRNGKAFVVEFVSIAFHDSKGRLRAAVHIRDLSEQERNEKALRESELRWQFALESHGDSMWDWDADKDELYLTGAAKELFKLPATDFKLTLADLMATVHDADRALVQAQIDSVIIGKASEWSIKHRVKWSEEVPRWIATRGRVMTRTANGKPQRIVSISSDFTQQKLREVEVSRLKEHAAHQARLVLLGGLASALAHEINQPLAAITAFAAVCARKIENNPEALKLVRAIEAQVIRGGEIAWRMRGFARRQSLGRMRQSLHEVMNEVAKWIYIDNVHLDVIIDVTGVDANLPQVDADRVELEQVLINLVRNGIEAARPNTKERRIAVAGYVREPAGEVEIAVTDWGCGLPSTANFDIFQPFVSSKEEGLGIGLTVCFSIIEEHGGRLWATPNPEGGTIFHFTLPIAR